ncbi:MAG: hypothetical protein ABSD64_07730 [Terriglobales bacterium]|jgi:hypothetical protein
MDELEDLDKSDAPQPKSVELTVVIVEARLARSDMQVTNAIMGDFFPIRVQSEDARIVTLHELVLERVPDVVAPLPSSPVVADV